MLQIMILRDGGAAVGIPLLGFKHFYLDLTGLVLFCVFLGLAINAARRRDIPLHLRLITCTAIVLLEAALVRTYLYGPPACAQFRGRSGCIEPNAHRAHRAAGSGRMALSAAAAAVWPHVGLLRDHAAHDRRDPKPDGSSPRRLAWPICELGEKRDQAPGNAKSRAQKRGCCGTQERTEGPLLERFLQGFA